jgi:hypothetical protein
VAERDYEQHTAHVISKIVSEITAQQRFHYTRRLQHW